MATIFERTNAGRNAQADALTAPAAPASAPTTNYQAGGFGGGVQLQGDPAKQAAMIRAVGEQIRRAQEAEQMRQLLQLQPDTPQPPR